MQPFHRYRHIVHDYQAFVESLQRPLPVTFWTNPAKCTAEEVIELLTAAGFPVPEPIPWLTNAFRLPAERRVGKRWEFFAGLYQIQEEAAMVPVALLQPQPGERVLDMCAAPGNKTAQVALAMQTNGTVVSNELNGKRAAALKQTCERLGLYNVTVTNSNGTNLRGDAAQFDRILVDAPCSGEGTTRKGPNPYAQSNPRACAKQQRIQQALLAKAFQLCKVGGRIVYATCTYAPEENEVVLQNMLDYLGREVLRVVRVPVPRHLEFSNGLAQWQGTQFYHEITRSVRLWPHQNDTGGFFIAVLKKIGEVKDRAYRPLIPVQQCSEAGQQPDRIPDQCWHQLSERFGWPEGFLKHTVLFADRKKELSLAADSLLIPQGFRVSQAGLRFLHRLNREARLTHPGAMAVAWAATRNVIDIDEKQRVGYFQRRALPLSAEQVARCDGPGYVLVRHAGKGVGGGVLKHDPQGGWYLQSSFPKTWARRLLGIKEDKPGPPPADTEQAESGAASSMEQHHGRTG